MNYAIKKRKYDKLKKEYDSFITGNQLFMPSKGESFAEYVYRVVEYRLNIESTIGKYCREVSKSHNNNIAPQMFNWIKDYIVINPDSQIAKIYSKCIEIWEMKDITFESWLAVKMNINVSDLQNLTIIL